MPQVANIIIVAAINFDLLISDSDYTEVLPLPVHGTIIILEGVAQAVTMAAHSLEPKHTAGDLRITTVDIEARITDVVEEGISLQVVGKGCLDSPRPYRI